MAGQVYAAAELGMWCFSKTGKLFFTTSPNEQGFLGWLKINGCLDYLLENKKGWDKPVILSDSLGMIMIGESILDNDGQVRMHVVVGPMFLDSSSVKEIEDQLRNMITSIKAQREIVRLLQTVPVLHISSENQYASMLHFTITDEMIFNADFYYQHEVNEEGIVLADPFEEDDKEQSQGEKPDRAVGMEQQILKAVREGNDNIHEIMDHAASTAQGYLTKTGSSLRDAKNTLIVLNALSCRAASDGGLSNKIARETEHFYMAELEKCNTNTQLHHLSIQMLDDYVAKVKEAKSNESISRGIQECCDYIRSNVQSDLSVEEIAKHMGYTPYYFTKKFNKEVGIKVTDYIKNAKIDYAKIALISTQRSVQDISDSLHFGTRNYFSKVFRDVVGMTPVEYRERMG